MTSPLRVAVYDSNRLNPYGRELASLLRASGLRCNLYAAVAKPTYSTEVGASSNPKRRPVRDSIVAQKVTRRIKSAVNLVNACIRNEIIVAIWVPNRLDAASLLIASSLGRKVHVIDHNPQLGRAASLSRGLKRTLVERCQSRIVHSTSLKDWNFTKNTKVVAHLPYTDWRARFEPELKAGVTKRARHTVLYMGSLRDDKGLRELPTIIRELKSRPLTFRFVGSGLVPRSIRLACTEAGIGLESPLGGSPVSDAALAGEMGRADVLFAPYSNVSQSGSILLAVTCGLPVIAWDAQGLRQVLAPQSLAPSGDVAALTRLLDRFLDEPWSTSRLDAQSWTAATLKAWKDALSLD